MTENFFRNRNANENDDQDRSTQAGDRSQAGQGSRFVSRRGP
jgi:hypothetical protein